MRNIEPFEQSIFHLGLIKVPLVVHRDKLRRNPDINYIGVHPIGPINDRLHFNKVINKQINCIAIVVPPRDDL